MAATGPHVLAVLPGPLKGRQLQVLVSGRLRGSFLMSAHLVDIESDDDAVSDRVCALEDLDDSISLQRGKPGGHDIARYRQDGYGVVCGRTQSADKAGVGRSRVLSAEFPGEDVVAAGDGGEVGPDGARRVQARWCVGCGGAVGIARRGAGGRRRARRPV